MNRYLQHTIKYNLNYNSNNKVLLYILLPIYMWGPYPLNNSSTINGNQGWIQSYIVTLNIIFTIVSDDVIIADIATSVYHLTDKL